MRSASIDTPAVGRSGGPAVEQACPLCGCEGRFAFLAVDRNRRITEERFPYYRCPTCSTVFLGLTLEDPGRYYGPGYHQFDAEGRPLWSEDPQLLAAEAWRVAALRAIAGTGPLIDIGAGAGGFAAAAKDGGFEVTAIEMDGDCCAYLEGELGVRAVRTDQPLEALAELPPARVVTLWHVLEHLPEPRTVLAAASRALQPGGVLALAVPNPDSIQFRLLGARWAHLDAPRHVCLARADAIIEQAAVHGLEPVLRTTTIPLAGPATSTAGSMRCDGIRVASPRGPPCARGPG